MKILSTLLLLLALNASAATSITNYTALLTVTNASGTTNGQTLTVVSDVRRWTNSVVTAGTDVLTNNTASGAASALLIHLGAHPFAGMNAYGYTTNSFQLTSTNGAAWRAVTPSAGWATVTYSTNIFTNSIVLTLPIDVHGLASRTNLTGALTAAINDPSNTNTVARATLASYVSGTLTNPVVISGTITNNTSGNAATATLASFISGTITNNVSGTLTNNTTGNATTATTASFTSAATLTNQILASKLLSPTNVGTQLVDFNVPMSDFQTNAAFNFTGFVNINSTNYNIAVTLVTNSTASAVAIGVPAAVHAQGVWYVTNWTVISWFCTAGRITNAIAAPQF